MILDQFIDRKTHDRTDRFGDEVSQREDGVREDRTDNTGHKTDTDRFPELRDNEDDRKAVECNRKVCNDCSRNKQ